MRTSCASLFWCSFLLFFHGTGADFTARNVTGTPPRISVSEIDNLPEFGEKDIVFVLFSASRPILAEGANEDAHSSAELEWWTYPFVANAAMMAFQEQVILQEGPSEWCGYNFRLVFADECPGGPASDECHNVYALRSVLSRFSDGAGHSMPRAAIGGTFWGKSVAQLLSAMQIPTVGFWMGEQSLDDKKAYPWFIRTYSGYGLLYQAIIDMIHGFQYTKVLMWHGLNEGALESKTFALDYATQLGITLDTVSFSPSQNEFYPPEPDSEQGLEWQAGLDRARTANAHCFIYTTQSTDPWLSFHLWMLWKGLFGPGYLWIQEFPVVNYWPRIYGVVDVFAPDSPYNTHLAFDGMIHADIETFGPKWQAWHNYVASLENRTGDMEPWIVEKTKYQPNLWNQQPDDYPTLAHLLFDAIYATLWATNDLILENGGTDFSNEVLLQRIWDSDFEGVGGPLAFDPDTGGRSSAIRIEQSQPTCINGVRQPAPDLGTVRHIGTYRVNKSKPQSEWLNIFGELLFYDCSTTLPPNLDLPCEPGTYYHRRLGSCLVCDIGKFSSTVGASACVDCAAGSYFNGTGAQQCVPCAAGTFANATGASQCLDCPAGEFQGEVLQSACRSCPAGQTTSTAGRSICENCGVGTYQPEEGNISCIECAVGRSTEFPGSTQEAECLCPEGMIDINGTCKVCGDGLQCDFGSALANWNTARSGGTFATGTYPQLQSGFWSSAGDPLEVYKCESTGRCPGGDPGICASGLQGRSCASCGESQWWDLIQCQPCKMGSSDSWLFPWIPFLATPVIIVVLYSLDRGDIDSWRAWPKSISCFGFVMLNHLQVITLLEQANYLKVPDTTEETSEIWKFTVDWLSIFKLECAGYAGVEYEMFFRTFAPMLLVLWVCVLYAIFKIVSLIAGRPDYRMQGARIFDVLMSIIFSFFTAIVAMSLLLYKCEDNPNGTSSLKADRSVLCYEDGTWQDLLALSIVAVIFYCGGMFTLFIWAILRARRSFSEPEFQKKWKFLFIRYRLSTWWWSLSFLGKNVLFNLALVVTFNGLGQLYIMMGIMCAYMVLVITFMPYRVQLANYLEIFTALSAIGTASVLTHFVEDVSSQLGKLDALSTALILLPVPLAIAYTAHVLILTGKKMMREYAGESARDQLFSRLFTASAALVDLNTEEVSNFLDRVDEPDRHVIKKALVIIESEIMGYPHWRLQLGTAPISAERLEKLVQCAMQGKTFNLRTSQMGKMFSGNGAVYSANLGSEVSKEAPSSRSVGDMRQSLASTPEQGPSVSMITRPGGDARQSLHSTPEHAPSASMVTMRGAAETGEDHGKVTMLHDTAKTEPRHIQVVPSKAGSDVVSFI
mmetsp:Transcript_21305/g.49456  ORF Transcript_21305/g.49456 Transcript_21305/m.49456 type:complete len:1347 (-) Transcript_21305:129-4169(-)